VHSFLSFLPKEFLERHFPLPQQSFVFFFFLFLFEIWMNFVIFFGEEIKKGLFRQKPLFFLSPSLYSPPFLFPPRLNQIFQDKDSLFS